MYELAIIEKLGLQPDMILCRPIRGLPGFTLENLVYALITTTSIEEAAGLLGYSDNPVKVAIRNSIKLSPLYKNRTYGFATGGKTTKWRNELLLLIDYKYCNSCNRILHLSDFGSHVNNDSSNHSSECSSCHTYRSKLQKIDISNRTPSWANLSKIREIYNNCPKDHHVDHIIPLRGTNVSGLHIEYNLQYLPCIDNLKKSNKY